MPTLLHYDHVGPLLRAFFLGAALPMLEGIRALEELGDVPRRSISKMDKKPNAQLLLPPNA